MPWRTARSGSRSSQTWTVAWLLVTSTVWAQHRARGDVTRESWRLEFARLRGLPAPEGERVIDPPTSDIVPPGEQGRL